MDDCPDPISQFFPDVEPEAVDLYAVLSLTSDAKAEEIKKAYRKLALVHHPDKHAASDDNAKAAAALKFQQIGFAYNILSDEKKRERYDKTGRTDEGFDLGAGEDGWEAYFEDLFEKVTKQKLDEMKKEYQHSEEELEDLKAAYIEHDGSIDTIMQHIPHSTFEDEARFIVIISGLIQKGDLPSLQTWQSTIKDEKSRLVRKKQGEKESREAEELAKELGVWEEFYGSGKPSSKRAKGKGKATVNAQSEEEEEDTSALQALILKKRNNLNGFFDSLATKYAEPAKSSNKKKRGKAADDEVEEEAHASPRKRTRKGVPPPPEIDDEEFEKLQQRLLADRPKDKSLPKVEATGTKGKRGSKGRKAK
ncbi:DnaJ-domain-containing protein [Cytidiella melzeri]|nr:DnaJ-domain-containing protein [Cytidiella melzeri]